MSKKLKAKRSSKKIKPSTIRIHQLLWWERNGAHSGEQYNCPCVVSLISEGGIKVISFDDGGESQLLEFSSDACKEELRPTTKKEVRKFINDNKKNLKKKKKKLLQEVEDLEESIAGLEGISDDYLR